MREGWSVAGQTRWYGARFDVVGLSGGASRLEDGWWLPEGHGNDLYANIYLLKLHLQEVQLSQRGRAMLLVVKYFAKSLKIVQGHWKWCYIRKLGFCFIFAFHRNYGRIFSRFDTIHERDGHPVSQAQDTARRQTLDINACSRHLLDSRVQSRPTTRLSLHKTYQPVS